MDSFSESREKLHSNVLLLKKDPIKCHIPKQRVYVNCENCSQSVTDKNATEICYGQTDGRHTRVKQHTSLSFEAGLQ